MPTPSTYCHFGWFHLYLPKESRTPYVISSLLKPDKDTRNKLGHTTRLKKK